MLDKDSTRDLVIEGFATLGFYLTLVVWADLLWGGPITRMFG